MTIGGPESPDVYRLRATRCPMGGTWRQSAVEGTTNECPSYPRRHLAGCDENLRIAPQVQVRFRVGDCPELAHLALVVQVYKVNLSFVQYPVARRPWTTSAATT